MSTDELDRDFAIALRGYDKAEVDRHLRRVGSTVDGLRARVSSLEEQLERRRGEVEEATAAAEPESPSQRFDAIGQETARILVAAEESATQMRDRARREADETLADAQQDAAERIDSATSRAEQIAADAEQHRDQVVAEADRYKRATIDEADRYRRETTAEADQYRETTGDEADEYQRTTQAEADAYSERVRTEADDYRTRVRAEADQYRADVQAEADQYRVDVRAEADQYRVDVQAEADDYGEQMRREANRYRQDTEADADRYRRETQAEADRYKHETVAEAESRRAELVADADARVAAAEAQLARLHEVRAELVDAVTSAVGVTTAAVAELDDMAPEQAAAASPPVESSPVRDDEPPVAAAAPVSEITPVAGDAASEDTVADETVADDAPVATTSSLTEDRSQDTAALWDDHTTVDESVWDAADGSDGAPDEGDADDEPSVEQAAWTEPESADDPSSSSNGSAVVEEQSDDLVVDEASVDEGSDDGDVDQFTDVEAAVDDATSAVPLTTSTGRQGAAPAALRSALADAAVATEMGGAEAGDEEPPLRREQSLVSIRPGALRRLRRGLQEVQNGVLQSIRDRGDEPATSVLPGPEAGQQLADLAMPFLDDAYVAGLVDAAVLVGDEPPSEPASDRLVAADASDAVADELVAALRTTLLPSLEAGVDAEEADASLSERVGEVFRDLKGPVVETVIDRHLTEVYGLAAVAGWRDRGTDQVTWVLGEESRCPENRCRSNAAEGPVESGTPFPSGDVVPPAHDGCACALAPAE